MQLGHRCIPGQVCDGPRARCVYQKAVPCMLQQLSIAWQREHKDTVTMKEENCCRNLATATFQARSAIDQEHAVSIRKRCPACRTG